MKLKRKLKQKFKIRTRDNRCLKVIVFFAGYRRQWPCLGGPESCLSLLKYVIEKESELDYGCHTDICIINHEPNSLDWKNDKTLQGNNDKYNLFVEYLNSVNGLKTKNGNIIVHHKENDSDASSGWNFAYEKYKKEYKYWNFTEDDCVTVRDNVSDVAINLIEDDPSIGLISTYGWWKDKNTGYRIARGFTGVISSSVIEKVFAQKNEQGKFCNDFTESGPMWHSGVSPKHYGFEREERSMNVRLQDSGYKVLLIPLPESMVQWKNGHERENFKNFQVGPILCIRNVIKSWDKGMER
jgi:hypothetical protein